MHEYTSDKDYLPAGEDPGDVSTPRSEANALTVQKEQMSKVIEQQKIMIAKLRADVRAKDAVIDNLKRRLGEPVDPNVAIHPTAAHEPYALARRLYEMSKAGAVTDFLCLAKVQTPQGIGTMPMLTGGLGVQELAEFASATQLMAANLIQANTRPSTIDTDPNGPAA